MKRTKLITGSEVVKQLRTESEKKVADFGVKLFEPSGSWYEENQLLTFLDDRKSSLSVLSVERDSLVSKAVWDPATKKAVLVKKKGKLWDLFGHHTDSQEYLYPEEALYLVEMKLLTLFYEGMHLSVEMAYAHLISEGCMSLEQFRVFSYLSKMGYKLVRHKPPDPKVDTSAVPQERVTRKQEQTFVNITPFYQDISSPEVICLDESSDSSSNDSSPEVECLGVKESNVINLDDSDDSDIAIIAVKPARTEIRVDGWSFAPRDEFLTTFSLVEEEHIYLSPSPVGLEELVAESEVTIKNRLPNVRGAGDVLHRPHPRLLPRGVQINYREYRVNLRDSSRDGQGGGWQANRQWGEDRYNHRGGFPRRRGRPWRPYNPLIRKANDLRNMARNMMDFARTLMSNYHNNSNGFQNVPGFFPYPQAAVGQVPIINPQVEAGLLPLPIAGAGLMPLPVGSEGIVQFPGNMPAIMPPDESYEPYAHNPPNNMFGYSRPRRPYRGRRPFRGTSRFYKNPPQPCIVISDDEEPDNQNEEVSDDEDDDESEEEEEEDDEDEDTITDSKTGIKRIAEIKSESNKRPRMSEDSNDSSIHSIKIERTDSNIKTEKSTPIKEEGQTNFSPVESSVKEEQDVKPVVKIEVMNNVNNCSTEVKQENSSKTLSNSSQSLGGGEKSQPGETACSEVVDPSREESSGEANSSEKEDSSLSEALSDTVKSQQADPAEKTNDDKSEASKENINEENVECVQDSGDTRGSSVAVSSSTKDSTSPSDGQVKNTAVGHELQSEEPSRPSRPRRPRPPDKNGACQEPTPGEEPTPLTDGQQDYGDSEDYYNFPALVQPQHCSSIDEVLGRLQIFGSVEREGCRSGVTVLYDMFLPSTPFVKSAPGPPNFRVIIHKLEDSLPCSQEMNALRKVYNDKVPFLFAVLLRDSVAFYQYDTVYVPVIKE